MRIKFASIYFLTCIAAVLILRLILWATEPVSFGNNIWVKDRARRSLEGLAPAPAGKKLVIFLGASEVEADFNPLVFDAENEKAGVPTWSLNLGLRNTGTFLPLYLDRITHELKAKALRPDIILLHIPVSRLTKQALAFYGETKKTHDVPSVYFGRAGWASPDLSWDTKATLAFDKYLLGERSPLQLHIFLSALLPNIGAPKAKEDFNQIRRLFLESGILSLPAWTPERRGQFYGELSDASPVFTAARRFITQPENFRWLVRTEIGCCDFRDLELDPEYVAQVRAAIGRLAPLAGKLVIVTIPENSAFVRDDRSAAVRDDLFSELANSAGGTYLNLSGSVPPQYYIDLQHFTPTGTEIFAQILSRKLREPVQ